MTTADLHPKRFPLNLTVAQLRQLADELQTMEHAPHQAPVPADKMIERDRAGEQLLTHVTMLLSDNRDRPEETLVNASLPLLRTTAKYLLTACDRCRRAALLKSLSALRADDPAKKDQLLVDVRIWDVTMRQLGDQHGVTSSLRELVEPLPMTTDELALVGFSRETLFNGEEVLARF